MAEIDGGALSFKSVMDNDQINAAIEETLRRVQGLSDGTVAGGKKMDAAFDATADNIRGALGQIGAAIETHEQALQRLQSEYKELGQKASAAFSAGRDDEYRAITQQQTAIRGEITMRERLIKELRDQSNELENVAQKQEENRQKVEENANAQVSMRSRIKALREEMMLLVDQGIDEQSEAYQRLKNELGRLIDIQSDVAQQGRTLANDEQKFQGIITGLSGLAGGFSAVTGAVSLFAGENEDLNKVMTKVQSVMAITIGLQQVAQTLNKDSAFQLVTMNSLKEWWRNIVAKATVAETAETVATMANTAAKEANTLSSGEAAASETLDTAAKGANTVAATTGTVANLTLAGAFRAVGAAIMSIPVFGWIVAGITALAAGVYALTSKQREAKKAQEEFNKAIVEGVYKPIGSIEELSEKYKELGNNLEAKKTFIEQNKKAFDELGVSVNDVTDAENLLIRNKDAFIEAQIAKAKATVYMQQSMEKIKKQMELEQEISQMPDKVQTYIPTSSGMYGGTGYYVTGENSSKAKKKKELEDLKGEIKTGYQNAASEEQKGFNILKKAGINGANTYKAGTIGAIEQAISSKQDALKRLSDPSQIKANIKETEKLQKQLDSLTGKKEKAPKKEKDPFLELLEKQKKEYDRFMKWINSGDQILAKAANKEFAGLLKQGASYIEYLKNQREQILAVDVSNRSKAQNKQLRMLNDQIAEETKKTVLEAFNTELSDQLSNAKTVMEMLNIIAQKRKALANDNTEVDNSKKDTLDEAEKTALQKQKEETDSLLEEYASYLDKKIKLEMDYNNDITLLEKRRSQATTDADKEKINQAIANRTKQYQKDTKGTGDADYDAMVKEYANFEQKKQAIIDEFDEKRKSAVEHGNTQLVEELNKAQAKALSSLATNEMKENPNFEKLFGNLDELTTKKLDELLATFDGKTAFLGVEFDPKDLEAIKQKVQDVKNEIQQRNPFKALISSFKEYSNATDDESKKKSLTKMFSSASASIDMVKGTFDSVVAGLDKMGISADEQTSQVLNDIGGMMEGASQLAQGIATGNPLAIIQGSISLISNGYDLIFGGKDRRAERSIKKHQENIEKLSNAYKQLEWQIDKALGSAVYQNQQAAINNMKQQQVELLGMINDEESKKKTDSGKIKEWQEQIAELDRNIQDAIDEISKDILQTDAKTFADELGDALVEAFGKGEDAAQAFAETVNDVVKQAVLNQLKKNFLETQLQGALDNLYTSMGGKSDGTFVFDGLTDEEIAAFKNQVSTITTGFNQALEEYTKIFKDIAVPDTDTSLTGAVKGVSEETASLIGGQMNAMRINQMEATAILRQQLSVLNTIASNTAYNKYLQSIDERLNKMNSGNDTLRAQGSY